MKPMRNLIVLLVITIACFGGFILMADQKQNDLKDQIEVLQAENIKLKSPVITISEATTYIACDSSEFKYIEKYEIRNGRAILHLKGGQVLNYPADRCKFVPGYIPLEKLSEYGCFVYVVE